MRPDAAHRLLPESGLRPTSDAGHRIDGHTDARPAVDGTTTVDAHHAPDAQDGGLSVDASRADHTGVRDAPVSDAREGGSPLDHHVVEVGAPDVSHRDARPADAGRDQGTPNPATCAEAHATSGTVTLYVGGDHAKAWQAECTSGATYLILMNTNYSTYPTGPCATGNTVTTTWTKVAIDPTSLIVDTSDFTGATSMGNLTETTTTYSTTYTRMPYGSARTCGDLLSTTGPGAGAIDLTGTPFTVAAGDFTANGYLKMSQVNVTNNGSKAALYIGGDPAGISPCASDYYTNVGGPCLQLAAP